MKALRRQGHEVLVTASDKDVTLDLLRSYRIPFISRGRNHPRLVRKLVNLPRISLKLASVARRFESDVLTGINNPYVAQAAKLLGVPSVIFDDTEWARWINLATLPFAKLICTPRNFGLDLGRRHLRYDGYHELAYVHPKYYKPDPSVAAQLSQEGDPYVIVRLIKWTASHDRFTQKSLLTTALGDGWLDRLARDVRVWIVSERELPTELREAKYPLPPRTVLDAFAGCAGYLGEGATMATEAALLGKPSIFVSPTWFGSMDEIEGRFGLLHRIPDPAEAIERFIRLINDSAIPSLWASRRQALLASTVDVTQLCVSILSDLSLITRLARGERDGTVLRGLCEAA